MLCCAGYANTPCGEAWNGNLRSLRQKIHKKAILINIFNPGSATLELWQDTEPPLPVPASSRWKQT